MLKIRSLKINITTNKGIFGNKFDFSEGLNIIRGNNTAGKSTIIQSMIYALGMEEIFGGKGIKVLQSVLKDEIEYKLEKLKVVDSEVLLEIENKEVLTIKRSIISNKKDSKLVEVIFGPLLTEGGNYNSKEMYLHDAGSAQDSEFGFHAYLEEFLNWKLPSLNYSDGTDRKLYLTTIFPTFIIEQKIGWSDFLATTPFYGLKNGESKSVEFILDLDLWNIEKKKQLLNNIKNDIILKWHYQYDILFELSRRGAMKIKGLTYDPEVIKSDQLINLLLEEDNKTYTIEDYIDNLNNQLNEIESKKYSLVGLKSVENENNIKKLTDDVSIMSLQIESLCDELEGNKSRLNDYNLQLGLIENDLRKNISILKIEKFGGEINLNITLDICPTCNQELKDTLLDQNEKISTMSIEDNISFLKSKEQMIKAYINGLNIVISNLQNTIESGRNRLIFKRSEIRALKQELVSDDRLPSTVEIEKKINLRNKIIFYRNLEEELETSIEKFNELSAQWVDVISKLKEIPKDTYSLNDTKKISQLESEFKRLVKYFGYSSKSINEIKISKDKYLPIIDKYNIRFDSSASDLVRSIWAYTCSLYTVSEELKGNHPGLLIFDEPGQHSMSDESLKNLLLFLSNSNAQSIVAASFNNDDEVFSTTTKDVKFHLIHIPEKSIAELN